MNELLRMQGISKSFSGVEVLHSVDLQLFEGEGLALVGENGAGKSTLMKILMGIHKPDMGDIWLRGEKVEMSNPAKALALGVSMIHQELNPVLDMTIAENMFLGRELRQAGFVDMKAQNQRTQEWLDKLKIRLDPTRKLRELTTSQMQIVEIAKAISYNAQIIIMDEPTSAITDEDAENLFEIVRVLKQDGIGIIYISHRLDELSRVADRVQVLRDGSVIRVSPIHEMTRNDMVRDMVGRELTNIYPKCDQTIGAPVMEVRSLTSPGKFQDVSFSLRQGEKLGIAGLMGAGRTELVNALFGADPNVTGELYIHGERVTIKNPAQAIKKHLALIPEDRKRMGLNLQMSVQDNTTMCVDRKLAKKGFLQRKRARSLAEEITRQLTVKAASLSVPVGSLSGGNQQKVVLAKWMLTEPDILLFDEPTRGIDVGAKSEIFKLINELVMQGKSCLIVSSEMQEVIGVSDRILVMCEGRLTGELVGEDITQENIMKLASPLQQQEVQVKT